MSPANQRPVFGSREQCTANRRPVFRLHGDDVTFHIHVYYIHYTDTWHIIIVILFASYHNIYIIQYTYKY